MSEHKILATIGVGDPDIGAEIETLITFRFTAGRPEVRTLRNGDPGYPADPAEVEFISAEPYCNGKPSPYYGAYADMEQDSLNQTAFFWLESDAGYQEAVAEAERALEGPDPDDARQARIDDEMMDRQDERAEREYD